MGTLWQIALAAVSAGGLTHLIDKWTDRRRRQLDVAALAQDIAANALDAARREMAAYQRTAEAARQEAEQLRRELAEARIEIDRLTALLRDARTPTERTGGVQ